MRNKASFDSFFHPNFLFLFVAIFVSISLSAQIKAPEFLRTKDWNIKRLSTGNISLTSKAVFFNPNKATATLKNVKLDIFANNKEIGNISQTNKTKIKGKSTFEIPLQLEFNLKDSNLDILSSILTILSNKKFLVDMIGHVKLKVFCIPFKVKINEQREFSSKDFL